MDKIKVYDVDQFMRNEIKMACHRFEKIAIFEGPDGVVVAEHEAVHDVLKTMNDAFRFDLTPIPKDGGIYLVPSAYTDVPISDIKENAPYEEMDFYDFFSRRNYNSRCEGNFRYMCKHLREIGYEIPKEPLNDKIRQAKTKNSAVQTDGHSKITEQEL